MMQVFAKSVLTCGLALLALNPVTKRERLGTMVLTENGRTFCKEETSKAKLNGEYTLLSSYVSNDKLIAEKSFSYSNEYSKGEYSLKHHESGRLERISFDGSQYQISYRKKEKSSLETKSISVPKPVLYDEGLVLFIQDHWKSLLKGESKEVSIVVPQRLDYYRFSIGGIWNKSSQSLEVSIKPVNVFLRQLVKPIELSFNGKKELLKIKGLSPIAATDGELQEVVINYNPQLP